jgi:DNA-binding NtrC family response regulator
MDTNAEDIDMVILNLNTPKCSAHEMIDRITQRCPDAPVLLASGMDDEEATEPLLRQGAAAFLLKPFSLRTLAETVRQTLDEVPKRSSNRK